jgi:hypothetical protein
VRSTKPLAPTFWLSRMAVGGYRFRHDLVREAVYGSLLPGERARFHHRVATALAAHPELVPREPAWFEAELAFHWWEAGVWMEALPACAAAAAAEAEMFAFADAKLNLTRALLAWDRLGDDTASSVVPIDRAALLEQAADAAFFADSLRQVATELAQQAIEAVDAHSDPRSGKAMGYVRLARYAASDDLNASLAALEAAASLVPSEEPSFELSRILTEQTRGLMLHVSLRGGATTGRTRDRRCAAPSATAQAEVARPPTPRGCASPSSGRFDEGDRVEPPGRGHRRGDR